jgi:BlaI family transcriptional regulator, penicillinase repressor
MPVELTELQLAIMRVLWGRGEAAVSEVHSVALPERALALTTVATLLTRLERAGLVSRRQAGRHYLYRALVSEEEVRRSMINGLADRLFHGDVTALVSHLLAEGDIASGDLERVRRLIDQKQRHKEG